MPAKASLSGNDAAVLGALFDPEASLQNHARIDFQMQSSYDNESVSLIKDLEMAALLPINTGSPASKELEQAISDLSNIIGQYPRYPSTWNNRAQARRMLSELDDSASRTGCLHLIFSDLAKSIELASPSYATQMTSPDNAKVLASAHTHRGYLLWKASRSDTTSGMLSGIEGLNGLDKERLEELASRDFMIGGRYGNQTAQQLAVKTNPYAKLCGSIVREALQKEIKDFYDQSPAAAL